MTIFMPLQAPTIDSFLHFLHNTPHACSHVRTLWLSRHMNFCYHPPREQRLLDIEADVLPYIVRSLPRLRHLVLDNIVLSPEAMADRSFDESLQLQTLRITLDEREDEDRHVDDLLATLKLFRGLEELDLNGIYNCTSPPSEDLIPRHLRLQRFSLTNIENISGLQTVIPCLIQDLQALSTSSKTPQLHSLEVDCVADNIALVQVLLENTARSLRHLSLTLCWSAEEPCTYPPSRSALCHCEF